MQGQSNNKTTPVNGDQVHLGLENQLTISVDLDDPRQNGFQDSVEESMADWDPLQGGYQDIVDICEAARSKPGPGAVQHLCFEPQRTLRMDQTIGNTMPPPLRFCSSQRTHLLQESQCAI